MQNRSSQLQHPFIDLEGNPLYLGCKELWTSSLFFDFHVLIPYSRFTSHFDVHGEFMSPWTMVESKLSHT
jgi:hypothetical protein